jgi:hypothetical protein
VTGQDDVGVECRGQDAAHPLSDDDATARIDRLIKTPGDEADIDPFVRVAGQILLATSEW